ncbi:MAG: hypothetical protein ACR2GY_14080, partial [Phycisphaerales bacterium]
MTKPTMIALAAGCMVLTLPAFGQGLPDRFGQVSRNNPQNRAQDDNASKSAILSKLLYEDITVNFDNTNARDAIQFIANRLGINIIGRY